MEQPFIIKYKPSVLENFEIKDEIKKMINFLIDIDFVNILFVGNSGSGKSTLTDIIIKQYYKDSLNSKNYSNNNILYINTLKEQGIHYYRNEVKTFCQTKNSDNKKKKFLIIDDIDMINEQGQQVFRNCLDKYKNNINFICTCTNLQKVIESLQSRQLIIKIKCLTNNDILKISKNVIEKEQLTIDDTALDTILDLSNSSVRVMLNYLDKCRLLNKKITNTIANNICTDISYELFDSYTNCILHNNNETSDHNIRTAIKILYNIYDTGYSVIDILDNYFIYIKISTTLSDNKKFIIIKLLCKYISIFYEIHEEKIELALFTNNLYRDLNKES